MSSSENIPEKTHVKSVRTLRREGQKGTEEFVIKTRIGSVMANLDMRKAVDELVLDVSKRLHRMSILCNLRVRQAIDEKVSFGHMFDQSYIRRMMMETDIDIDRTHPSETLASALQLPCVGAPYPRSCNVYNHASTMYLTNWETYLKMNFEKILSRYLRAVCKRDEVVPPKEVWIMKAVIMGQDHKRVVEWINHPLVVEAIAYVKRILYFRGEGFSDHEGKFYFTAYKNCASGVTPFTNAIRFIHMVSENPIFGEVVNRTLTLAPLHVIRRHFVMIDDTTAKTWSKAFKCEMWAPEKASKKHAFTGTVSTDGVAACMHFRRPSSEVIKPPKERIGRPVKMTSTKKRKGVSQMVVSEAVIAHPNERIHADKRILALDPGRTSLATIVEYIGDYGDTKKSWKRYEYTRKQYYHEAGINVANRQSAKWNAQPEVEAARLRLTANPSKAKSVLDFLAYINAVNASYEVLWGEYSKKKWNSQRFALHQGKQRSVDQFCNRLERAIPGDTRPIELAYGNASFSAGGRGERCVPVKWFRDRIALRFKVVDVDEFRSSKISYQTQEMLGKVGRIVGEEARDVRGLHWYKTNDLECKYVHRDSNAAKNIHLLHYYLVNGLVKPLIFQRIDGAPPLPAQALRILQSNETGLNAVFERT